VHAHMHRSQCGRQPDTQHTAHGSVSACLSSTPQFKCMPLRRFQRSQGPGTVASHRQPRWCSSYQRCVRHWGLCLSLPLSPLSPHTIANPSRWHQYAGTIHREARARVVVFFDKPVAAGRTAVVGLVSQQGGTSPNRAHLAQGGSWSSGGYAKGVAPPSVSNAYTMRALVMACAHGRAPSRTTWSLPSMRPHIYRCTHALPHGLALAREPGLLHGAIHHD
jgi:hypothetical protein